MKSGLVLSQNKYLLHVHLVSRFLNTHIFRMCLVRMARNSQREHEMSQYQNTSGSDISLRHYWTSSRSSDGIPSRMKRSWLWMRWYRNSRSLISTSHEPYLIPSNLTGWMENTSSVWKSESFIADLQNTWKNTRVNSTELPTHRKTMSSIPVSYESFRPEWEDLRNSGSSRSSSMVTYRSVVNSWSIQRWR